MRIRLNIRRSLIGLVVLGAIATYTSQTYAQYSPQLISEFLHNGFKQAVPKDTLLVAAMNGGIGIVQLEETGQTGNFKLVGFVGVALDIQSLKVAGDSVIASLSDGNFAVYNIADPTRPTLVNSFSYQRQIMDYLLVDDKIYFAEEYLGVTLHRIQSSGQLSFLDSTMIPIRCIQLNRSADTLFVLDDYNGIDRFLINNSDLDHRIGYLLLPFQANSASFADPKVVLACGEDGFRVATRADSAWAPGFQHFQTVTFAGRVLNSDPAYVVVSGAGVLEVLPKADPDDLQFVSSNGKLIGTEIFRQAGRDILVTTTDEDGLAGFRLDAGDINDPFATYSYPGHVTSLEAINGYLYTAGVSNPLEKYAFVGLDTPQVLGRRGFPAGVVTSTKRGDTLYLLDTGNQPAALWIIKTSLDSLPRVINTYSAPSFADRLEIYRHPNADRRYFVYRAADGYHINRAEPGQMYGDVTSKLSLGVGVSAFAVCQGRLFRYSSKGTLHESLLSLFYVVQDISQISIQAPVHEITPSQDQSRLILLSPRLARVVNVATQGSMVLKSQVALQGDYRYTRHVGDLIFACGPNSTGILKLVGDTLKELGFLPNNAQRIEAYNGLMFTTDGASIRYWEYTTTGVEDDDPIIIKPVDFTLVDSYPNPFNGATKIRFAGLPKSDPDVRVDVYNVLGQLVRSIPLSDPELGAGEVLWDGRNANGAAVASGVYFARAVGQKNYGPAIKMIYLK